MKTLTQTSNKSFLLRNILMVGALLLAAVGVQAEPLQPNTLYVTTGTGLYAVDETAGTASRVAAADPAVSRIEDIAFDGGELYGLTGLMQFFKYNAGSSAMEAINGYTSYALSHNGLAVHNGVFYAAELRGLQIADPQTGHFTDVGPYGLGAGETVTDLASGSDGTLYAAVTFNITYGYDYLATLDTRTGEMNIIGNTYISGLRGLAEKDGVLYGVSSVGDLYSIDRVSGAGTLLHRDLLPGAYGMATSPANLEAGGSDSGSGSGSGSASAGGALSWPLMLVMVVVMLRLGRNR